MNNEALKNYICSLNAEASFDETGDWLNIVLPSASWKATAASLLEGEAQFDHLFCVTCIDWKTHLTMVYHLSSTIHRNTIVAKIDLDRNDPSIETVSDIWRTAEFHEREVYEMFGVQFKGHPDLRRLILTDDFNGFPLRKDFEDPINMIKL
jgi:NADH:ubiquinone oxidoreductase subunit C